MCHFMDLLVQNFFDKKREREITMKIEDIMTKHK